ncbi:MAG: histidinol-phosphate transaminase [Verrucomicrobia bacterium]|nr:histidinol-phosphate transaminase [Verrucomicrobiota bacterium]
MVTTDLLARANPWLNDIVSYIPGKPIDDVARELGLPPEKIVKLASNENPIGPSPKAVAAMTAALAKAHFYPDGGGYHLRTAIARKFGLDISNVILGNGSNEIIEFLGHAFLRPGDNIIVADHAFVIYKLMAHLFGASAIEVADPGLTADVDAMVRAITPQTKLIYLANPNNPTGTMVGAAELERLINNTPNEVAVVLDEAYYEFLASPPDTLRYVHEMRNVILLRTFSKIQGLASLRIGYGLAHPDLIKLLHKTRQPFNANAIAQVGAIAGLEDDEHQQQTRALTFAGVAFLQSEFEKRRLEYVPSSANFVLVKVGDGKAIFEKLLRRGTIVRATGEYKLPEWVRVSVGTMEQNRRFLDDLDAVMAR